MSGVHLGGAIKAARVATAFAVLTHVSIALAADSRVQTWASPDRQVALSSVRASEGHYRIELVRAGKAPVVVDEYERHVDALWSADSKYVAITDWIGSNVADCYIIDAAGPERKTIVTNALPTLRENVTNSHFYVSCKRWVSKTDIAVEAAGHTDYWPSHAFMHRFVLDVLTGHVRAL